MYYPILAAVLIRGVVVFSLLPILSRLGYGMSVPDAVVATWGGLRGAVGIALALVMEHELKARGARGVQWIEAGWDAIESDGVLKGSHLQRRGVATQRMNVSVVCCPT